MWLLKLHLSVSILCLLTFIGFKSVCRETLKKNGYLDDPKKKASYWIFFIPILNVISVIILFLTITKTKDELQKWCEDIKNKKKEEENTH